MMMWSARNKSRDVDDDIRHVRQSRSERAASNRETARMVNMLASRGWSLVDEDTDGDDDPTLLYTTGGVGSVDRLLRR